MDEREFLDSNGYFWEPVRTDDEKARLIESLAKLEEARAKQEEQKTERAKLKQGVPIPPQANPNDIVTEFATMTDTHVAKTEFLVEPYLPRASVVGFFGRGETAKSSFIATMAADISGFASTLWISSEESAEKIMARHVKGIQLDGGGCASRGLEYTLQVIMAIVTSTDAQGRPMTTDFNSYEHLEPAIIKAKTALQNLPPEHQPVKPLRLVVIDTAVALTTWGRHAGPNSDEGVKHLLSFLRSVAERQDVTIAIIGHSNKGKHDHFADSVMGATAWVNSPRITFLHAKHMQIDDHVIVRVAKANEIPHMAQIFSLHMVHELHQFVDGPKAGMMKMFPRTRVWGAQQAEELWDEVTAKLKDDESDGGFTRLPTLVEKAIQALVEMVMTTQPGQHVTREDVEQQLGRPLSRREWLKVDDHMHGHPTVALERGAQNRVLYRRRT